MKSTKASSRNKGIEKDKAEGQIRGNEHQR